MFNNFFFGRNSRSLCDNVEKKKYGRAAQATVDSITRRMRIACSVTKATNTHSGYVILIAFPLPQWLHERTSVLRYLYIASLVRTYVCVQLI